MNRKFVMALAITTLLVISMCSAVVLAKGKPDKPPGKPEPEPEFPVVDFDIQIGLTDEEDLILLKETKTGQGLERFRVPVSLEDYTEDYASNDEHHGWAHFDGGYGAEPIALGINDVEDTALDGYIDASVEQYNGQGVIEMLWLWYQWGINDGVPYEWWSIRFWWWTEKTASKEVMMDMIIKTTDGFELVDGVWTITFDEMASLEEITYMLRSRGKSKGRWIFESSEIVWSGQLSFTVTVAPVQPLPPP